MSLVYLFPGQGSQRAGMGRDLFGRFPDLVATADKLLGYSIERLCLDDPDGRLGDTTYTQPALYVVNALSYHARCQDDRRTPEFLAGHSLGEYNALLAAGVFDFETGLELVRKRGALMGGVRGGGMAAVIGMDAADLKQVLSDFAFDTIDVANYNAARQTVISGPRRDIEDLAAVFEDIKTCRYVILKVSGAFHSRYMREAAAEFERLLAGFEFRPPRIPVISNVFARPYRADAVRSTLAAQISHPVRWSETIAFLRDGRDVQFHEIGPGRALTGLLTAE